MYLCVYLSVNLSICLCTHKYDPPPFSHPQCSTFTLLPVVIAEFAPVALLRLCQHLLGVSAVCEDVTASISTLCDKLVMVILEGHKDTDRKDETSSRSAKSNGSRTPSRSPVTSTPEHVEGSLGRLVRHLVDYFQWLRTHRSALVKMCRIVEVVECVHPSLRCAPPPLLIRTYHRHIGIHT